MYEWDQDTMGFISPSTAHEEEVRAAIIAGCTWYDALDPEGEKPRFSGATYAAPQNDKAHELVAVVMDGVTATGLAKHEICTLVVRSAEYVHQAGGDPDGWEAFKLITPHALRTGSGVPAPPLPPAEPVEP